MSQQSGPNSDLDGFGPQTNRDPGARTSRHQGQTKSHEEIMGMGRAFRVSFDRRGRAVESLCKIEWPPVLRGPKGLAPYRWRTEASERLGRRGNGQAGSESN